MKHDALMGLTLAEMDRYGRMVGVDTSGKRTKKAKAAAIEEARERTADAVVLGVPVTVPMKRLHDKRVTDGLAAVRDGGDDAAFEASFRALLGDEQADAVYAAATDEDGTVDNDALALAYVQLMGTKALKN